MEPYLDTFLDMFNGEIFSYSILEKSNFKSINEALNEAISITNDCNFGRTFHSNQGWAYQMNKYGEMCYGKTYKSFEELKSAIEEYIYYYNNKRIKEKLKWRSPVNYRIEYESKIA